MSMQELAVVQQPVYTGEERPTTSEFSRKQQGIGRTDAEDNVDFETTSFGTVLTTADNLDHTR